MYVLANQLEISGGLRRSRAECLVDAAPAISPQAIQKKGLLYLITEIEGASPTSNFTLKLSQSDIQLCHETQSIILREYYNYYNAATITSALRHALEVANSKVFERNKTFLPSESRGVGVTCAVVRGTEIFLAQMFPTQAFLTHQGQLRAFPPREEPYNQENREPEASQTIYPSTPLGRHTALEPSFTRQIFNEGDLLVLCSSNLGRALFNVQGNFFFQGQDSRVALLQIADFARTANIKDGYAMTVGNGPKTNPVNSPNSEIPPLPSPKPEERRLPGAIEGVAASVSLITSRFSSEKDSGRQVTPPEEYPYLERPQMAPGQGEPLPEAEANIFSGQTHGSISENNPFFQEGAHPGEKYPPDQAFKPEEKKPLSPFLTSGSSSASGPNPNGPRPPLTNSRGGLTPANLNPGQGLSLIHI